MSKQKTTELYRIQTNQREWRVLANYLHEASQKAYKRLRMGEEVTSVEYVSKVHLTEEDM